MPEVELTPGLKLVYDFMRAHPCKWLTVRDVRVALDLTNGVARYRLNRLSELALINRYRPYMLTRWDRVHKRWVVVYRIFFHYVMPPGLYKIKIRIYSMERRVPTPEGMFQTFWDIDARLDPATGLVDWDWHLTKTEVEICKYHMVGYFKGLAKWQKPEELGLSFWMDEKTKEKGIPYTELTPTYKRPYETYAPNIPTEFIEKALKLNMRELIVGESSIAPKPVTEPGKELGVFFQKVMVIGPAGTIVWSEIRNRWVWKPGKDLIERVKKELGIE